MSALVTVGPELFGKIVVIKRSGQDGSVFPLTMQSCILGRGDQCSIRIQLDGVDEQHCVVEVMEDRAVSLKNISTDGPTLLNGKTIKSVRTLGHKDVICVKDRLFRFEYPEEHDLCVSPTKLRGTPASPKKKVTPGRGRSKSLDVGRTPPRKMLEDVENTSPNSQKMLTQAFTPSNAVDMPCKILTAKKKPPTPGRVKAADASSESDNHAPKSPAPPGRQRGASLRKSLTELKQRSTSIAESPETASPTVAAATSTGKKRKSKSPLAAISAAKRKRVSFGSQLSPELFDKRLPPGTPIQRGSNPRRHSVDAVLEAVESPRKSLLKRKSIAHVPQTATITEESPRNRRSSPRQAVGSNKVTPSKKKTPSPKISTGKKAEKSPEEAISKRRNSRHVTVKSPHVPHQEMSDSEVKRYAEIRHEEGEIFRRLSHSPDNVLSPPVTPAAEKYIADSASPELKSRRSPRSAEASPVITPLGRKATPINRSPNRKATPKTSPPAKITSARKATPAKGSPGLKTSPVKKVSPANGGRKATPAHKFISPQMRFASPVNASSRNPTPAAEGSFKASPKGNIHSKSQSRTIMTPGKSTIIHMDTPRPAKQASPKTPASVSPAFKMSAKKSSKVEKLATPPIDFTKAVALRAIHGKHAIPQLSASAKKSLAANVKKATPKKATPKKTATPKKRTPVKRTWADVVKKQAGKKRLSTAKAKKTATPKKATPAKKTWADVVKKRKSTTLSTKATKAKEALTSHRKPAAKKVTAKKAKAVRKTPARALGAVSSTGHADSPATIILTKSRRSVGTKKIALSPASLNNTVVPPTPEGPGIMAVSPMSTEKPRKQTSILTQEPSPNFTGLREIMREPVSRKSVSLVGVKELLGKSKVPRKSVSLVGVKELLREPKKQGSPQFSGVKQMFQSAREHIDINYVGVREMMQSAKRRESASLIGMKEMFLAATDPPTPNMSGMRDMFIHQSPGMFSAASPNLKVVVTKTNSRRAIKTIKPSKNTTPNVTLADIITSPPPSRRGKKKTSTSPKPRGRKATTARKSPAEKPTKRGNKLASPKIIVNAKRKVKATVTPEQAASPVPKRGRPKKVTATKAEEIPKKRGRKVAVESTPQVESPPRARGKTKKVVQQSPVEATPAPKRGRPKKVAVETPAVEAVTPVPKRGRPKKVAVETPAVEAVTPVPKRGRPKKVVADPAAAEVITPVTRRGRPKKVVAEAVAVEPVVVAPRKGRPKKVVEESIIMNADAPAPKRGRAKRVIVDETEAPAPKRGRAKIVIQETPVVEEVKPKRGRAAAPVELSVVTVSKTESKRGRGKQAVAPSTTVEPAKPKRGKSAKEPVTDLAPPPTPSKRGRKPVEDILNEITEEPPKRGRKATTVKEPVEKPKRGRKPVAATVDVVEESIKKHGKPEETTKPISRTTRSRK